MFMMKMIAVGCAVVIGTAAVSADVIMPDYHVVSRCVTIDNLDEYPDIAVVGGYRMGTGTLECYEVKKDSCLTKGYKFNSFYLFWVEKSYLASVGIDNIAFAGLLPQPQTAKRKFAVKEPPLFGLIGTDVEPYGGTVPDSNPVVSEQLTYRLDAGSAGFQFTLNLEEKVTVDKDGNTNRETYLGVGVKPGVQQNARTGVVTATATLGRDCLLFTPSWNGAAAAELIDCRGKSLVRFTRDCTSGYTYLVGIPGLSAGVYWLRIKSASGVATIAVKRFE